MSKKRTHHPGTWFLTGFIKVTQILIIYSFVVVTDLWESRQQRKIRKRNNHNV